MESFPTPDEPLDLIEKELARFQTLENKALPPFDGGAVGFVGHEFIHTVEPSVQIPETDPLKLPILYYMITDSVLIFDHVKQVLTICVYAEVENPPEEAYQKAVDEIKRIFTRLQEPANLSYQSITEPKTSQPPKGNFERDEFEAAVQKKSKVIFKQEMLYKLFYPRDLAKNLSRLPPLSIELCEPSIPLPICFSSKTQLFLWSELRLRYMFGSQENKSRFAPLPVHDAEAVRSAKTWSLKPTCSPTRRNAQNI